MSAPRRATPCVRRADGPSASTAPLIYYSYRGGRQRALYFRGGPTPANIKRSKCARVTIFQVALPTTSASASKHGDRMIIHASLPAPWSRRTRSDRFLVAGTLR
jgi:hypothetical protein